MGFNDENSLQIVCDIETVASPHVETLLDPVRAPSNYKDVQKIQMYQQEKLAEIIAKASLEPDLCEVVALGVQWDDQTTEVVTRADRAEDDMLIWFWDQIGNARLVGFNILNFDLPVLIRRSQLLGVKYPNVNLDRYRTGHVDLLERLSFNGKIPYRSLAFYCRRFSIPCEDTVAGADIPGLVASGEWGHVREHCASDITKTALLAQRLGWFTPVQVDVA